MKDRSTIYLAAIIAVCIAVFLCGLYFLSQGTAGWISKIEDPTERGLAYVATAIVLHSFLNRTQVDVKVDGKKQS